MKIRSSYTALLVPLLVVFLTTAALPFSAFGADAPATDAGLCQVGAKEINPAVLMNMKDMGDRVLRALYDKATVPLLAMSGFKEDNAEAKKTMEAVARRFWPREIAFDTGKPVYSAWVPRVPAGNGDAPPSVTCDAAKLFNSETCTLYPPANLAGKSFGVMGYVFGTPADSVAIFVYLSFENGALKLVDVSRHQIMLRGRSANSFETAALQARSFGDHLMASALLEHAATLIPNGPRILFDRARILLQQAAVSDKGPASEKEPLHFHCKGQDISVWRYDLFFYKDKALLRVTFEAPSLDEKTVAPIAACVETVLGQTHPRAGDLFDGFLLEARVLPPSTPGEFWRKTIDLTKKAAPKKKKKAAKP